MFSKGWVLLNYTFVHGMAVTVVMPNSLLAMNNDILTKLHIALSVTIRVLENH